MRRLFRTVLWLALLALLLVGGYGYLGYRDARAAAPELGKRADALIAAGRGGVALGMDRQAMLLAVEDPAFASHYGLDFTTPGAGPMTITQSLAEAEGFADFTPGLRLVRQTGFAIGLEAALSKPQILALYLDDVPMGAGPDGPWLTGLFAASEAVFDAPPSAVTEADYLALLAVIIAPDALPLVGEDAARDARVDRIRRLVAGDCAPAGHGDVWLEGCAGP